MPLLKPTSVESFNQVPDKIPPIEKGVYTFLITEEKIEPSRFKEDAAKGFQVLNLRCEVDNDCPMKGKSVYKQLGLPHQSESLSDRQYKETTLKNMFTACGIAPELDGGLDTGKLKGSRFMAEAGPKPGKDKDQNEQVYSNIGKILKPDGSGF